jgi:phage repressor protein C with HTH and peptisase S24 domain
MNSDAFKGRLKKAMNGISNRSFADKCAISEGTLRRYLLGETYPPLDTLEVIAHAAGVCLGWLATGDGPMKRDEAGPAGEYTTGKDLGEDFVLVPRYEVAASAGGGAMVHSEQIVDHLAFRSEWVRNALDVSVQALALISVKGDSMEPTLSNGDLILVDTGTRRVEDNAIYVLRYNGSLMVKRVQRRRDGSLIIKSDNKIYDPEVVTETEVNDLHVVGRVVWSGRRM